ncbi:hypothetical protein B0H16DRAFT_1463249 [Mycena metata]|uniref:Uncharacterized protein n=1 Tax=Mycena metata TaxID=1033252 RepID=A0AAD7IJ82_9AGAR|nr:hypothetical protein B0H16DRAFT_1463249 [Mycena metata]
MLNGTFRPNDPVVSTIRPVEWHIQARTDPAASAWPNDPVARAILNGTFRPNDPVARKIHLPAHRRPEQYLNGTFRPNDPVARKIHLRAHRRPEQYLNGTFRPNDPVGTCRPERIQLRAQFRPNDPVVSTIRPAEWHIEARKIQLPEQIQLRARYGPVGYRNGTLRLAAIQLVRYPEWCIREVDLEEPFRGQKNSYGAMVLAEWKQNPRWQR